MAVDVSGIRVTVEGAAQANRDLGGLARNLERTGKAGAKTEGMFARLSREMTTFKGILGSLGAGFAVQQLLQTADTFQVLQRRIQTATRETGDFVAVSEELRRIANSTGSALSDNVGVFQSLARSATELGATNTDILKLTKTVQQLGVIGGATTQGMSAGLLQFSQGLAAGVFRAEEFNSILENLPEVANRIARGMDLTVGQLRALVLEGKVASEDVFDALLKQSEEINKQFGEMPLSLAQSMQTLNNEFTRALGEMDKQVGVTSALAAAMRTLADNMDTAVTAAGLAASLFAGRFAASLVTAVKGMSAATTAAGLLRGALALLGGPVGVGVAAAGAMLILTTRTTEASEAIDQARTASQELNRILEASENLTLSAAEAARKMANDELLAAQASLIAAQAENELSIARSGRLLAGTPIPGLDSKQQLTRETKQYTALQEQISELFAQFLKADEAVRQYQRSAKGAATETGNLTGETGKLTKELTDMERAQSKLTKALIEYEGREMVREIERQFAASEKLTDSTLDIGDALREVTEQTGPFEEAFSNTFRRIDDAGANFWQNLLEGGKSTFGSLKDLAVQTGAEILHALTTRRLTQGISNAIVPGAAAGIGAAQLGGGFGFSPTSLLNAGVSPFVDASTFMQSAGLTGNLGIAAGGALPGLGVGALTTMLTGGSGVGNAIGGALGGALGNVLLPGIGGLVGSALGGLAGGLFGGSKKAKIRLGGGAGGFEDSVFSQSAFGNIGLAGSRTKRVDAAEFKPFFDSIAQLDNLMANSLLPEQIDKVRASLEGFTSQKLTSSDPFRPEQLEQLIRERMGVIFNAVGGDISRLAQSFRNLPLEQMVAGFNALNQVARFTDSRPLEDFGRALQDNNRTLQEATRQSRNAIIELVNVFDGSLGATQRLAAATQQRYSLELQLLDQINNVSRGITSSFESTRETIIRAGLSQEELFNRVASQAEGLIPQLMQATDPARIGDIAGRINQLVGESFRMLSPEQQQGVQPGFLDFLGRTEGIAQGRLSDVQQTAVRENGELRKVIRDELGLVARDQRQTAELEARTAENNRAAAEAQLQAARMQVDAARQEGFYAGLNAGSRR